MKFMTLRTEAMELKYTRAKLSKKIRSIDKEKTVDEVGNWRVVKNRFPYNLVHDPRDGWLVVHKTIKDFDKMTKQDIKDVVKLSEMYAAHQVIWNTPPMQTQPQWLHFHLLRFKKAETILDEPDAFDVKYLNPIARLLRRSK